MLARWILANVLARLAHVALKICVSGFGLAAQAILFRAERLNHLSQLHDLVVGSHQLLLHLDLRLVHVHGSEEKA